MSKILDKLINIMKWPVALYLLFSVPAFIQSVEAFKFSELKHMAMFGGFFMFFIARSFMDSSVRTGMEVLAHELTHAFFALLTFHKVRNISINPDDSGGAMAFEGEGNWLIVIGPYFFPLFGLVAMIAVSVYTMFMPMNLLINGVIGFVIGYHMDAVGSQIHEKQTDLPKVGYWFCAIFLPPANMWMIGSMLAFNSRGWQGVWIYQDLIGYLNDRNLGYVLNMFGF